MKKSFTIILITAFLVNAGELIGQKQDPNPQTELSQMPTAMSVLFNRVLIYHKDGGRISGLLVGIEGDALIVRVGTKDERIQFNNLAKIIIQKDKKKGRYALSGMLLGIYVGNLALCRAKNQPPVYMEDIGSEWSYFLRNAILAAAGGGLGILGSSILEKGEKVFDFTGNMEKRHREWERLRRFVIGDTFAQKKVHFRFQAGKVFTRVSDRYRNLLIDNDYHVSRYGWLDNETWEEASDINLLRKVQLTYSLNTFLEIGVASSWLGEPSIQGNKWGNGESSYAWQKLYAIGFYAVGVFKPFSKVMPKSISWEFGIGAGAAKVNFSLKARSTTWYPTTEVTDEHNISKTIFSGIAFTELSLYLYDAMSLGLIADYAYVPEQQAPAMPVAGLPAQKLRLGNGSIGFVLGLHF